MVDYQWGGFYSSKDLCRTCSLKGFGGFWGFPLECLCFASSALSLAGVSGGGGGPSRSMGGGGRVPPPGACTYVWDKTGTGHRGIALEVAGSNLAATGSDSICVLRARVLLHIDSNPVRVF